MNPPNPPGLAPSLPLENVLTAFSDGTRWRILAELVASDEPLMVLDLSKRLGLPATNISKHINILRRAGLVQSGRANLYRIPAQFLVPDQPRALDLGVALLRFDRVAAG